MAETTQVVPAEHMGAFRLAVAAEIQDDGEWVANMGGELLRRLTVADHAKAFRAEDIATRPADMELGDVMGSATCLAQVIEIAKQAFAAPDGETVEITGTADALAHIGQTMAREVLPKMLDNTPCPFEEEERVRVAGIASSLAWACDEATGLYAIAEEELRAKKAERDEEAA